MHDNNIRQHCINLNIWGHFSLSLSLWVETHERMIIKVHKAHMFHQEWQLGSFEPAVCIVFFFSFPFQKFKKKLVLFFLEYLYFMWLYTCTPLHLSDSCSYFLKLRLHIKTHISLISTIEKAVTACSPIFLFQMSMSLWLFAVPATRHVPFPPFPLIISRPFRFIVWPFGGAINLCWEPRD